jgi:hypothetical protein
VSISEFVSKWNATHKRFTFSVCEIPVQGRPANVEIRYPAAKYQKFLSTDTWNELNNIVEMRSHHTMYVATNEKLFKRGIIEIKIASSNHNYQDRFVTSVLIWIAEHFFPQDNED